MLKIFRSGASSKILFGFLGLALFAMVVTGFGTGGGGLGDLGGGGDTIAEVGSGRIGSTEVADQANRQFARARDQPPAPDMGAFLRSGPPAELIDHKLPQTPPSALGTRKAR